MSQYENGSRYDNLRVNTAPRLPVQGVTESLQAPGVAPTPYVPSEGMKLAVALGEALNVAGNIGNTFAHVANNERIRADRAQSVIDENERQINAAAKGLASAQAASDVPIFSSELGQSPSFIAPADIPGTIKSLQDRRTAGMDPLAAQHYIASTTDNYTKAVVANNERVRNLAVQQQADAVASQGFTTANPSQAESVVADVMHADPKKSYEDASKLVYTRALHAAVASGDEARFAALKAGKGAVNVDPLTIERLDNNFIAAKNKEKQALNQTFDNAVAASYLDKGDTEGVIKSWRGKVDDEKIQSAMKTYQEGQKTALNEAKTAAAKSGVDLWEAGVTQQATASVRAGVAAMQLKPETYTDAKGVEHTKSVTQQLEDGMNAEFANIEAASSDPNVVFANKLDLSANNGYQVPQWKATLNAGGMAASETAIETSTDGKSKPIPRSVVEGYKLYSDLATKNPGYLAQLGANQQATDYYAAAKALQELDPTIGGDAPTALLAARRVFNTDPSYTYNVLEKQVRPAVRALADGAWSNNAKNPGEIAADVERLAGVFVRSGIDPKKAVDLAKQKVETSRVIVNKWSMPLNNTNVPREVRENIDAVSKSIITDWASKYGESEGVEASDLAMRPGSNGQWIICQGNSGLPVGSVDTVYSMGDMLERARAVASKKLSTSDASIINRQNNGSNYPSLADSLREAKNN